MATLKKLLIIWLVEIILFAVLILGFTCVRFVDGKNFIRLISVYEEYASFDADASLVLEGAIY